MLSMVRQLRGANNHSNDRKASGLPQSSGVRQATVDSQTTENTQISQKTAETQDLEVR